MLIAKLSAYITNALYQVREEEDGQGLVEYALIIALVSIVLIGALGLVAGGIGTVFTNIGNTLSGL